MEELTQIIYKEVCSIFSQAIRKTAKNKKYNIKNVKDCQILICNDENNGIYFKMLNNFKTIKNGEDKDKIFTYNYIIGMNPYGHMFKSKIIARLNKIFEGISEGFKIKAENTSVAIITNDNKKAKILYAVPYEMNGKIAKKLIHTQPLYDLFADKNNTNNYLNETT